MSADWSPLRRELARWHAERLTLPVWWRDDDATAPTPALDTLAALAADTLPVHLAVIPRDATPALAARVADDPALIPLVHGWAHENHAPTGEKKAEFGAHRASGALMTDAQAGLTRLRALFGAHLAPVFVPPWNRIAPDLVSALPGLGYAALSTFTPRDAPEAAPGLAQINTHLDPIDWRGTRSLARAEALIDQAAAQLADRREGRADNGEPFGLLTHHLVHDGPVWSFTNRFLNEICNGPVRPFTHPTEPRKDTP